MKYICIDSNIFRHLFSRSKSFGEEIEGLLVKLIDNKNVALLLPLQIEQEVERNRFGEWYKADAGALESQIHGKDQEVDDLESKYPEYAEIEPLVTRLRNEKRDILKKKDELKEKYFSPDSPENKSLQKVVRRATLIPETNEIHVSAWVRQEKRNPPRDSDGHFGDAIIWESLLSYFVRNCRQSTGSLILVSDDKKAWGDGGLNPWLENEWTTMTSCGICLVNTMADVDQLTQEEQDKIRKTELLELKHNALTDFVGSDSFVEAGTNATKLLSFKDSFDGHDLEEVLRASTTNFQITQSFFTRDPLFHLVHEDGNMAVKAADLIDDELWKKFSARYEIKLWRHKDLLFQ